MHGGGGGAGGGGRGGVVVNLGLSIFLLEVGDGGGPLVKFFSRSLVFCLLCGAAECREKQPVSASWSCRSKLYRAVYCGHNFAFGLLARVVV